MKRTNRVEFVLSDEEIKKAKELAAAQGLSIGSLLRRFIVTAPTPTPRKRAAA